MNEGPDPERSAPQRTGAGPRILLAGPTASGKSALALALARRLGATVVNADSMQVYRDLRVLSARPAPAEEAAAPHALYGVVDGAREYNVGDWLRDVLPLLRAGGPLVFVGGTGLYFRALTTGLVEAPAIPPALRVELAARRAAGEDMHAALAAVDPASAKLLSPADWPRIARALEMHAVTGRPFSLWRTDATGAPALAPGSWTGVFLHPPRETLAQRIETRFASMIAAGALAEAEALRARDLPPNRGVMKAHGVPHLLAHLRGELSLEDACARGVSDTRRYAKRQLTWARRFMADWRWFEGEAALADAAEVAQVAEVAEVMARSVATKTAAP